MSDAGAIPDEPLVRLDAATRRYGTGFALAPTTLSLERASFTVVTGRSGAGKTTLLQLLAALDRPDDGRLWMFGRDITRDSESALSEIRRRRLGIVYQQFRFIEHLSVWQNVTVRLVPSGVRARVRRERAEAALRAFDLADVLDRRPAELSGGEQQRVAFARAIIDEPALLVADEPTSNVDEATGSVLVAALVGLRAAGTTVVVSTHDPAVIAVADRSLRMEGGRLLQLRESSGPDTAS